MKNISCVILLLLNLSLSGYANPNNDFEKFLDRSAEQTRLQLLKNDELVIQNKNTEGIYFFDFRKKYNEVEMVSVERTGQLNQALSGYNNNVILILMPLNAVGEGGRTEAMTTMQMYARRVVNKVDPNGEKTVVCINTTIEQAGTMFSYPAVMVGQSADQIVAGNVKSNFENITCKQFECFFEVTLYMSNAITSLTANDFYGVSMPLIVQTSQISDSLQIPVYFTFKIVFKEDHTVIEYGNDGIREYYSVLAEAPEIIEFIPSGRKKEFINKWINTSYWTSNGKLITDKEYTYDITYAGLWKLFSLYPDVKTIVEEEILALYAEDYVKNFLSAHRTSFTKDNINYFLQIAQLAKLMGVNLWREYELDKNQQLSATDSKSLQHFYDRLKAFYQQNLDITANIMKCITPGQSEGEMSYWCSIMAQSDGTNNKYFYALSPEHRYHILKVMSSGTMDGTDEYYAIQIIKLIRTTAERKDLYNLLKIDRTTFYNLYNEINGENLDLFNDQLIACFSFAFNQSDYGDRSIRAFKWPDNTSDGISHSFTDANTKIEFRVYFGAGIGDASPVRKDPVTVYIEEPVAINYGETTIFVPAICFYRKINVREFYNNLIQSSNVLDLIAVGTATHIIVKGTPGFIRVIAYAELLNFSLDKMFEVPEIKNEILKVDGGKAFLKAWPYINIAGDLTTVGADLLKNFVDGYNKIQRKGGILEKLPVEGQDIARQYYKSCEAILFLQQYPELLGKVSSLRAIYQGNYPKLEQAIINSSDKVLKALDDDITLIDKLGDIQNLDVNAIATKLDEITNVKTGVVRFIASTGPELKTFLNNIVIKPEGKIYYGKFYKSVSKNSELNHNAKPDIISQYSIDEAWGRYDVQEESVMYFSQTFNGNKIEMSYYGDWNAYSTYEFNNVQIDNMLDLTDDAIRQSLGTEYDKLVLGMSNKTQAYEFTNIISTWARANGYKGLIVPGARGAKDYTNIIVFSQSELTSILKGIIPVKLK